MLSGEAAMNGHLGILPSNYIVFSVGHPRSLFVETHCKKVLDMTAYEIGFALS